MSPKPRYARIAITLPQADLAAADRLARVQDRPRSWIIAEAIRRYVASGEARVGSSRTTAAHALERAEAGPPPGLGASRLAQLRADLRLTPEERVRAAEETARVGALRRGPPVRRVMGFERYEDFLAWKRREALDP